MKLIVLVVLVVLVLSNLILTIYLVNQITNIKNDRNLINYRLEDITNANVRNQDCIMKSFYYLDERLKKIPHEITVKNVLKIP
jgi:hypothetical protein